MIGNVFEWTRSLYASYPYDPSDGREDLFASRDELRVVRGGHFNDEGALISCSTRQGVYPRHPLANTGGFRVAIISEPQHKKQYSIEDFGWEFIRNISPTGKQLDEVNRIVEDLHHTVLKFQPIQEAYLDIIMYGSVARGTAILPLADVDILLLLKINPLKEKPKTATAIVRELLSRIYSKNQLIDVRKARRIQSFDASTIVQLPNRLRLEVTPAVLSPRDSSEFWIPEWNFRKWVPSNHKKHAVVARQFDQQTDGQFTALVKMFKFWYRNVHKIRIHSFFAECLVADNFDSASVNLFEAFEKLLNQLQTRYRSVVQMRSIPVMGVEGIAKLPYIDEKQFQSLMTAAKMTLEEINSIQEIQSFEVKVEMWRKIFGDRFPETLP